MSSENILMPRKGSNEVYRVLRIRLRKLSKREYLILERLTYHAKSVWNNALYAYKNKLLFNAELSRQSKLYRYARETEAGRMLYSQCVQAIVQQLDRVLRKSSKVRYMPSDGHRTIIWKSQSVKIKGGKLLLPLSRAFREYYEISDGYFAIQLPPGFAYDVAEVHVIPKHNARWFEALIVYKVEDSPKVQTQTVMGIDLGIDNFATVAISDRTAVIIDGRKAKSINQGFNKERAKLQSIYSKQGIKTGSKLVTLSRRRQNWMHNFLHQAAAYVIKLAKEHKAAIAVGYNKNWKQKANIGKRNNQNFVSLPHERFVEILKHKAQLAGIEIKVVSEEYTSKADALAFETIEKKDQYLGKRKHRGLYISSTGVAINADVNAAINITRKIFGDEYWKSNPESYNGIGASGCLTQPLRIRVV